LAPLKQSIVSKKIFHPELVEGFVLTTYKFYCHSELVSESKTDPEINSG
jgi:hypothetical protein